MMAAEPQQRSILVTGASTGIGRAAVAELMDAGYRVWATVRRQQDADALVAQHGDGLTVVLMDLLDEASVRRTGEVVCAAGPLYGLVNNAGAALPGPLEYLPIDVFRRQLEINLVGQLLVTQVMMPALRRSAEETGEARIVMIGSIGGRVAGPILGAYQTAKHGLVGLSDALRAELAPFQIKVLLIEPGAIATPIWDRGMVAGEEVLSSAPEQQRYATQVDGARALAARGNRSGLPPAAVGRVITEALQSPRPRQRQVVGRDAKFVAAMARLLPYSLIYRFTAGKR
jgi:NAD(P)-dependent dehydrogenase (short-subunit alcohol dehydrogenase family)